MFLYNVMKVLNKIATIYIFYNIYYQNTILLVIRKL